MHPLHRLSGPEKGAMAAGIVAAGLLSSWFGLTRDALVSEPALGFDLFKSVWTEGFPGADAVFVVGTLAAAAPAWWAAVVLAKRLGWAGTWAAVLVGAASVAAHWVVYALSFLALMGGEGGSQGLGLGESFRFTFEWGWPGLVFVMGLLPVAVFVGQMARQGNPQDALHNAPQSAPPSAPQPIDDPALGRQP